MFVYLLRFVRMTNKECVHRCETTSLGKDKSFRFVTMVTLFWGSRVNLISP